MIGTVSGFVAGLVGVPIIPLMPYLQALEVKPSELVQTLGIVLCATSFTLTASLLNFGLLDGPRAIVSAAAVLAGDRRHVARPAHPGRPVGRPVPDGRVRRAAGHGALYFRQPSVVIL